MIAIAMTRTKCTKRTRNRYFTSCRIHKAVLLAFHEDALAQSYQGLENIQRRYEPPCL